MIRLQIQIRYHLLKIIRKVSILNIVHKIEMVVTKTLKQKKHKKGKSGITRKSSDQALFEVARSQEFCGNGDLEFDSLSLTALERGETFIINNIEPKPYAKACTELLNLLMLFAEPFAVSNVLKFHHDVLKETESGRSTWNSNFDTMRARRLIDRVPRQYCGTYNKAVCKKKEKVCCLSHPPPPPKKKKTRKKKTTTTTVK